MASPFDSFDESSCHERLGSGFDAFGGGDGVGPEPGDCLLAISPPFLYDWETGAELPPGTDWHLYTFDKTMQRMSYFRDSISQQERDDGYSLWGGFSGGAGVYWCRGRRFFPIGGGRWQGYSVGYHCDAFGRKAQRFDFNRNFSEFYDGDPQWDISQWRFAAQGGSSGNVGNLRYPSIGYLRLRLEGDLYIPESEWHGLAHFTTGVPRRDDFRTELPPDGTWSEVMGGGFNYRTGRWGNSYSPAGGEAGFLLFGHRNGIRWRYTTDTFTIIPDSKRERSSSTSGDLLEIVGSEYDGVQVYQGVQYYGENDTGLNPTSQLKGGAHFCYYPLLAHRVGGAFPPWRIGIVREFTDWDGVFGFQPGERFWHSAGFSDIGTPKVFDEPNAPSIVVAGD